MLPSNRLSALFSSSFLIDSCWLCVYVCMVLSFSVGIIVVELQMLILGLVRCRILVLVLVLQLRQFVGFLHDTVLNLELVNFSI